MSVCSVKGGRDDGRNEGAGAPEPMPPLGGFFFLNSAVRSALYVLTYISTMLRHIKLKMLRMSILFRTFAISKDNLVITIKIEAV